VRSDYVAAFNRGVRTGDWTAMLDLVADDATLEFVGIPVGPFHGRAAIEAAYAEQPPDDEIVLLDDARYAWARDPSHAAGELQLEEDEAGRISRIRVLYGRGSGSS
jgi:hypothetical protein